MTLAAIAFFCLAFVLLLVGSILFLVAAFRQHFGWGLASLLVPGASLVFLILHWAEARKGFLIQLVGALFLGGSVFAALKSPDGQEVAKWGEAREVEQAVNTGEAALTQKETELHAAEQKAAAMQAKLERDYANLTARRQALDGNPSAVSAFNELAAVYQLDKTRLAEERATVERLRKESAELTESVLASARKLAELRPKSKAPVTVAALEKARPAVPLPPKDIVMYTTRKCPACVAAKQYLQGRGISYKEIDVNASPEGLQEFRRLGGTGVPLIMVNGLPVHGFDRRRLEGLL